MKSNKLLIHFFLSVLSLPWLLLPASESSKPVASPKHLLYPPPAAGAPTKVQLIFGLGIPMEVEVSTIVGYVFKCNYNLPYNSTALRFPEVRYQRSSEPNPAGRYEIYKLLERLVQSRVQSGRACLLRAICEAAESPLRSTDGLVSELLDLLLRPSSTGEPLNEVDDQEYFAAELLGRSPGARCERAFAECEHGLLDYVSRRRDSAFDEE